MTYEDLEQTGELLRVYYNEHAKVQSLQPAALPHADWKYEIWEHEGKVYTVEHYAGNVQIHELDDYTLLYATIHTLQSLILKTACKYELPIKYVNTLWGLKLKSCAYVEKPKMKISRETLYDLYITQDLSTTEIAHRYDVTAPTIRARLRDHKIDIKRQGRRKKC